MGIVLLGGGEVLSGFSTENIEALFVTTGIVTGVGMRYVLYFLRLLYERVMVQVDGRYVVFVLW